MYLLSCQYWPILVVGPRSMHRSVLTFLPAQPCTDTEPGSALELKMSRGRAELHQSKNLFLHEGQTLWAAPALPAQLCRQWLVTHWILILKHGVNIK